LLSRSVVSCSLFADDSFDPACFAFLLQWGLIPSYTKPNEKLDFFRMFNARIETVPEKPVFRRLVARKRCVVLLDGFYEWTTDQFKQKQPYYIHLSGRPMKMAGLYDVWKVPPSQSSSWQPSPSESEVILQDAKEVDDDAQQQDDDADEQQPAEDDNDEQQQPEQPQRRDDDDDEGGEFMFSYTILTTDASSRFSAVHNRYERKLRQAVSSQKCSTATFAASPSMPVLLTDEQAEAWLDENADPHKLLMQFGPYNGEDLVWHPVSKKVNTLSYLDSDCAVPIKLVQPRSITSFWGGKGASKPDKTTTTTSTSDDSAESKEIATESKQEVEPSQSTQGEEHASIPTVVDDSSQNTDGDAAAPSSPAKTKSSSRLRSPLQSPLRSNKRPTQGSPADPKRQKSIASFFGK
jgi:putative SOS response-associated peptidase YedK